MHTYAALTTRRTHHSFTSAPVPSDALQRALEAANHAPCHRHTWPWRFIVLGPRTRAKLADIAARVKGCTTDAARAAVQRKIAGSGSLVVCTQIPCEDAFQAKEDYAACACAVHNFTLSLHADGFSTKWGTGSVTRAPEVAELLDCRGHTVVGFLYVGTPSAAPPPVKRPPLDEVVRWAD